MNINPKSTASQIHELKFSKKDLFTPPGTQSNTEEFPFVSLKWQTAGLHLSFSLCVATSSNKWAWGPKCPPSSKGSTSLPTPLASCFQHGGGVGFALPGFQICSECIRMFVIFHLVFLEIYGECAFRLSTLQFCKQQTWRCMSHVPGAGPSLW